MNKPAKRWNIASIRRFAAESEKCNIRLSKGIFETRYIVIFSQLDATRLTGYRSMASACPSITPQRSWLGF